MASARRLLALGAVLLPSGCGALPVSQSSSAAPSGSSRWISPIAGCQGFDCVLQYIALNDGAYRWNDTQVRLRGRISGNLHGLPDVNWTGYVLNMTSQQWRTGARVDHPIWWHTLVVIVPDVVEFGDWATVVLDFGVNNPDGSLLRIDNRETDHWLGMDSVEIDSHVLLQRLPQLKACVQKAAYIAARTGAPAASLQDLPNSPEVFATDPLHLPRYADLLKAFSYQDFLDHPEEPERIVDLADAKAVVRAMDTIQAFTAGLPTGAVRRFGVTGYSKLATATYLTAAADSRVKAMAPMAIGMHALSDTAFDAPEGHSATIAARAARRATYGKQPKDWKDLYLPVRVSANTPEMEKMMQIIDPANFKERLTMPKLVATAANDRVLSQDFEPQYERIVPQMPGVTAYLNVPNCGHDEVIVKSLPTSAALFRGVLLGRTPPTVASSWRGALGTIIAKQVGDTNIRPLAVRRWDGPLLDNIGPWASVPLPNGNGTTWSSRVPTSPFEQHASFIELEFEWPEPGHRFHVSTMDYP